MEEIYYECSLPAQVERVEKLLFTAEPLPNTDCAVTLELSEFLLLSVVLGRCGGS